MSWNYVMLLGLGVTLVSVALGYRARQVDLASARRRYRWAVRLALGYAGLLFGNFALAGVRFGWAAAATQTSPEANAFLLGACLAAAMNLVLGFLLFGMAPTLVAFMLARRVEAGEERSSS